MLSHRPNRWMLRAVSMRGVLTTVVIAAIAGAVAVPASADPPAPTNATDAAKQMHDLSQQAEVLTEQYKKAQDDHAARLADLGRATGDTAQAGHALDKARADENVLRVQSDRFVGAAFEGARMDQISALLSSKSPEDYLDGASALDVLSKQQADVVLRFQDATNKAGAAEKLAADAKNRAAQAEAEAAKIENDLAAKKAAMDAQIAKAKAAYNALSAKDKASLNNDGGGSSDLVGQLLGSGAGIVAVNAALSRMGDPYVWGATGPSQFDCSGLMQWSYNKAGVSLPRSTYSQVEVGQSVSSESSLRPGDLVFFYGGSHVGMYVGGGKVVHAPTEGENVKVTAIKYMEPVSAMRRVSG